MGPAQSWVISPGLNYIVRSTGLQLSHSHDPACTCGTPAGEFPFGDAGSTGGSAVALREVLRAAQPGQEAIASCLNP